MKRTIICLTMLLSLLLSFNAYAMKDYKWTWLNDEEVARFQPEENASINRVKLQKMFNLGAIGGGRGLEDDGGKRDSYSGKWFQTEGGTWSFVFDDSTIPIDITRIDGVLYAFNGYGELVDGYKYWNDYKTGPDGLVTCTDPEFLTYLETQYIPDCTSHE